MVMVSLNAGRTWMLFGRNKIILEVPTSAIHSNLD